ncbi:MAG: hypothetical protein ABJ139_06380 [Paracoccaceae bacterium]
MFFVSSATADSRVNISPREIAALRVVDDNSVIYLDRTGSGNETAAHMLVDGRLTIMFCAFSGPPQIMRLYGRGTSVGWESVEFEELISQLYGGVTPLGTRQIMKLKFDLVQTSCGYGVPLFDYTRSEIVCVGCVTPVSGGKSFDALIVAEDWEKISVIFDNDFMGAAPNHRRSRLHMSGFYPTRPTRQAPRPSC